MQLQRIYIDGFRGLNKVDLDLVHTETGTPVPFLALIGPNGCGKTSVLHAVASLAHGISVDWKPNRAKDTKHGPSVHLAHTTLPQGAIARLEYAGLAVDYRDSSVTPCSGGSRAIDPSLGFVSKEGATQLGKAMSVFVPMLDQWLYVPAGIDPYVPLDQAINPKKGSGWLAGALDVSADFTQSAERDKRLVQATHQWLLHQKLRDDAPLLWDALDPFFANSVRYTGVNPENHDLTFDIGGTEIGFNELSGGQRKLILLFAMIVMHCKGEGILLFDEPENHFHPDWQLMLREALVKLLPKGQIICATHSPYMIEGLDPNELYEFGPVLAQA